MINNEIFNGREIIRQEYKTTLFSFKNLRVHKMFESHSPAKILIFI